MRTMASYAGALLLCNVNIHLMNAGGISTKQHFLQHSQVKVRSRSPKYITV